MLQTIWVDIRAAEVAEDNMHVISDEHVSEMGIIPYNIFGMKVSDPLGNFGKKLPDVVTGSRYYPCGGDAKGARR